MWALVVGCPRLRRRPTQYSSTSYWHPVALIITGTGLDRGCSIRRVTRFNLRPKNNDLTVWALSFRISKIFETKAINSPFLKNFGIAAMTTWSRGATDKYSGHKTLLKIVIIRAKLDFNYQCCRWIFLVPSKLPRSFAGRPRPSLGPTLHHSGYPSQGFPRFSNTARWCLLRLFVCSQSESNRFVLSCFQNSKNSSSTRVYPS
jgi:hypothetical protein